ncbi:MAG: hypothetical protein CVU16_14005 [Betaproteobacteria bacterium HGW-Betaproteobacteria-10]|nr:MAG: hypothetical protein CVU16_14005 [Betaproteobacteria bacterium HGW-Betaproteobacteria-10]
MSTILLCIATGQNLANLIPALQIKPASVWILATPAMRVQAQTLKKLLDRHQIPGRIEPFADDNIATLETESLRIAELLDGQHVAFNATGGTKQMALVLTETLQGLVTEPFGILYADTTHQRIDWLRPKGRGGEPMQDLLSLEDILGTQGFRLGDVNSRHENWVKTTENRGQLTKDLGDKAEKLGGFFGALNGLAQRATRNDDFSPHQELDYEPSPLYGEILKKAQSYELIKWDSGTRITFTDQGAARYFGGGWLEEYIFFKLRGCRTKDYAINAILIAPDGQTTNEIDALAVHHNRLLAIECKTLRFGRDRSKDADIMYKLDSLSQRVGGLMHQRMILSARPLDEISTARAKELNIEIIAGKDIRNFPDRIRAWMNH